jgi:hypothetical protein
VDGWKGPEPPGVKRRSGRRSCRAQPGSPLRVSDAVLAQAPHYKQSAVVAWLLEEEHRLLSAAAGFDRLADVVLNVAGDAVAAGFQAVAVALQAADGLLDCPVILRIDRPAVALSHVGEHKVAGSFQLIQVISFVMVLLARWGEVAPSPGPVLSLQQLQDRQHS